MMKKKLIYTDVLIVGTGIAGLSCALEMTRLHPGYQITLLDKSFCRDCNTQYAQGGMAAVMDQVYDSFQSHFEDTMKAGRTKSDPTIVNYFVRKAPEAILWLETLGMDFDKDPIGTYQLGKEGGHAQSRIVHHKDRTGREVLTALWKSVSLNDRITVLSGWLAKDLWGIPADHGKHLKKCCGVKAYNLKDGNPVKIQSGITVVATGGCGRLFARTTNAKIATGDGVAMAIRAGVKVRDMQYYQFHPTALYTEQNDRALLLTEALRGAGAYIVNGQGGRFLWKGHERGELATRDVICALMIKEMAKCGEDFLYLDARHLGKEYLENEFPQVVDNCLSLGLHPAFDLLPILPAAHYQCGGIVVDLHGRSSLEGLYALGECAFTGLHGKNRLASNSLTEGLVFAKKLAKGLLKLEKPDPTLDLSDTLDEMGNCILAETPYLTAIRSALQKSMNELMFCGDQLMMARNISVKIDEWKIMLKHERRSTSKIELENLLVVAEAICASLKDELIEYAEYN